MFSRKSKDARREAADHYAGLRRIWLTGEAAARAPAHLGPSDVIAVLIDWGVDRGTVTTLAAEDGTASLYTDSGWGIVGMGFHASTAAAGLALVGCAQSFVSVFPATAQFPLPRKDRKGFRIVTRGGVHSAEFAVAEMSKDPFLSPFLDAHEQLVTRMRLLDELRTRGAMHPQTLRVHVFADGGLCLVSPRDPAPTWLTERQLQRVLEIARAQGDRLDVSMEACGPEKADRITRTIDASGIVGTASQSPPPTAYLGGTQTLHYAVTVARADIVADMIARGANLEARDDLGYTPLILSAFRGRTKSLQLLVEAGADVRAVDRKGNSALMFAAQWGDLGAVQLLLDTGADPAVRGEKGYTALKVAKLCNQPEVARLLAARGAPE